MAKPLGRKFIATVAHVPPTKHTELEHFCWREVGLEVGRPVGAVFGRIFPTIRSASLGLGECVGVAGLHAVGDGDGLGSAI